MKKHSQKKKTKLQLNKTVVNSVAAMLLIIALTLTPLCFFLHNAFYKQTYCQITQNTMDHLAEKRLLMGTIEEQIRSLGRQLSETSEVNLFLSARESIPLNNWKLGKLLEEVVLYAPLVDSIYVYSTNTDQLVSNYGILSCVNFDTGILDRIHDINRSDFHDRTAMTLRTILSGTRLAPTRQTLTIGLSKRGDYHFLSPEDNVQIIINLNMNYLNLLLTPVQDSSVGGLLLTDQFHHVVTHSCDAFSDDQLQGLAYRLSDSPNGSRVQDVDGKPYFISCIDTGFWGYHLFHIASRAETMRPLTQLKHLTLLVSLCLIVISFVLIWYASHQIYSPYANLLGKLSGKKHNDSSQKRLIDPSSQISDSLDSLMEENESYKHSLSLTLELAQKRFIQTLLNNTYDKSIDLPHYFHSLDLPWLQGNVYCLFIRLDGASAQNKAALEDWSKVRDQINHLLTVAGIPFFYLNFNDQFLQYAIEHPVPDAFPHDLHHLQDFLEEQGQSVSFVASDRVQDAAQLHIAFHQCMELYHYLFITGEHSILTPVTFRIADCSTTCSIARATDKFLVALRSRKEENLSAALDSVFSEISVCTYDLAKLMINQLLLDFINCCNEILNEYNEAMSFEHLYTRLNNFTSLQQIREFFLDMGYTAIAKLNEKQESHFSRMTQEIKQYIHSHYQDSSLCVSTFAEQLHLTPGYVGKIFSRETDLSLPEYILQVRLTHAAKLLTETELLVSTISEQCGFSSRNYFASQFKKVYGISPKDYRAQKTAPPQQSGGTD